jgi:ketosteroid isomerase-like protein
MAAPSPVLSADRATALVRRLIDLVGSFEMGAALELVTDDLVLEFPFRGDGGPRRLQGDDAKGFIASLPKLFSQLPFADVVVHGQLPSGQVVAEYRSDGITRAGRAYPNAYVAFFGLRGDRVAVWREYFDPNVVAAAFPSVPSA